VGGFGSGRKSVSYKELAEHHGNEVDVTDPLKRTRFVRMLERMYFEGLSDKITAQKAGEEYLARVAGKPITPVDLSGTVTHQSVEKHVESILDSLATLKATKTTTGPETVQ
jgi:hypothetical protein